MPTKKKRARVRWELEAEGLYVGGKWAGYIDDEKGVPAPNRWRWFLMRYRHDQGHAPTRALARKALLAACKEK